MGLSIDDRKARNYGLKIAHYKRIYHVGADVYAFSFADMPVRLDLEGFLRRPHPTRKRFRFDSFRSVNALTVNGTEFLVALSERRNDLFTLFREYFKEYLIDPASIAPDEKVKHFYLDQKWIDQERMLPIEISSSEESSEEDSP